MNGRTRLVLNGFHRCEMTRLEWGWIGFLPCNRAGFIYIDSKTQQANNLFEKYSVNPKIVTEIKHGEKPYICRFCVCKRNELDRVVAALDELPNKLLICGYSDYPEFCQTEIIKIDTN